MMALPALALAAPIPYDSPVGGFAFQVPDGWGIARDTREIYPIVMGPKDDDRAPYVVITEMKGQGDLLALGDATVKESLKDPYISLSVRDSFHTADQRLAFKYVLLTTEASQPYRQLFYFVDGPGARRFVFMVTVSEAGWKRYGQDLDNMMKSFHQRPGAATVTPPSLTLTPGNLPTSAGNVTGATPQLPRRGGK